MIDSWQGPADVNVAEFNIQHNHLINLFYELQEALIGNKAEKIIEKTLEELIKYSEYHFANEERYFRQFGYPETEQHLREHEAFTKVIPEIKKNFKDNELKSALILVKYLQNWINNHIIVTDKKYSVFFNQHGLY